MEVGRRRESLRPSVRRKEPGNRVPCSIPHRPCSSCRIAIRQTLGAVRYYDGLTNDARLTLDTLLSAENHGAIVRNYVRYVGAKRLSDSWSCRLQLSHTGEDLELQARCVINATGPWSNKVPLSKTNLRLTKGVHLVVNRERLPIPDAVVFAQQERILFAIPWGERVILGTTDTDYEGPIGAPSCDADDARTSWTLSIEVFLLQIFLKETSFLPGLD